MKISGLITFLREGSLKKVFLIIVTYFNGSIVFFNEVYKEAIDKFYYGELFFSFIIWFSLLFFIF